MSLWQKTEAMMWMSRFPALTVMVFLRQDLGYRILDPLPLAGVSVFMFFAAGIAGRESYPGYLLAYIVIMLMAATRQRMKRWGQIRRGVKMHSFYIGTSVLDKSWLPNFCRNDRRLERIADPLAAILVGIALFPLTHALGLWLMFSGFCLRTLEYAVFRKELHQKLDMVDGLVMAEVQAETVEVFAPPPVTNSGGPSSGSVPTGLAADIRDRIKAKNAPGVPPRL